MKTIPKHPLFLAFLSLVLVVLACGIKNPINTSPTAIVIAPPTETNPGYFVDIQGVEQWDGLRIHITGVSVGIESQGFKQITLTLVFENRSSFLRTVCFGTRQGDIALSAYITGTANQETYYYWTPYYSDNRSICPVSSLPPGFKKVAKITIPIAVTSTPERFGFAFYPNIDRVTTSDVTSEYGYRELGSIPFSLETEAYPQILTFVPADFTPTKPEEPIPLENGSEVSIDWIETFSCKNKREGITIGTTYKNLSGTTIYPHRILLFDIIDLPEPNNTKVLFDVYPTFAYYDPILDNGIPPGNTMKLVLISKCDETGFAIYALNQPAGRPLYIVLSETWNSPRPIAVFELSSIPPFVPELHIPEYYLSSERLLEKLPDDLAQRLEKLSP